MRAFAGTLFLASATIAVVSAGAALQEPAAPPAVSPGVTRSYYIAADEVRWDYAPRGRHLTGTPTSDADELDASPTTYLKAIYREYTDATFRTRKPRTADWEHLGILGPVIRAEIGDTVKVVFRNQTNAFYSIHPHGLAYEKDSEGAMYEDGTSGADKADDRVPPGGTHTYTWTVPPRAGPAPGDASTVIWMYHSHFVEQTEMNTGLIGPIVIGARGAFTPEGRPRDVDREFVAAFAIFDETRSAYTEANLNVAGRRTFDLKVTDPAFRQRFLMYSINGFIDGNLPVPTMKRGERVRWYLLANSNEEDVHAAHWHGETVVSMHMRTDTVSLLAMAMAVADMVPDEAGTWLFHCHVNEHFEGGMQALFRVLP